MNAATKARDEALERVESASDPDWVVSAEKALLYVSMSLQTFSTDDVWDRLRMLSVPAPREPRALGPVMRRAVRDGLIKAVGYAASERPERHCAPVRMYQAC